MNTYSFDVFINCQSKKIHGKNSWNMYLRFVELFNLRTSTSKRDFDNSKIGLDNIEEWEFDAAWYEALFWPLDGATVDEVVDEAEEDEE